MKIIRNSKGNETIIYAQTFEYDALEQVKKMANFEAYENEKIRIMPDAHVGKGCTVGTTMTISDKITPNLVGVDIGCFTGDTKIPLLNGSQKTLKELTDAALPVYVYSLDKNLKPVAGLAIPKLTRKNATLFKVTVSGGEEIRCTPDHRFMLLNGTYIEAKNLKKFDSLMPLYRTYESKDGYEHIKASVGTGIATHKMVAHQFFGEKKVTDIIHHIDGEWYNNDPGNLEYKDYKLHSSDHRLLKSLFGTPYFKEKRLEKLQIIGFYSPAFTEKKRQVAITNITDYMSNNREEWKGKIKDNGERGKEYLVGYNKSEKGRAKSKELSNKLFECEICGDFIKSPIGLHNHKRKEHNNNHKVISVEALSYTEDVYCLTVEEYHNFALSAGVFVHNCGMLTVRLKQEEIDFKKLDEVINAKIPSGFNVHERSRKDFDFSHLRCQKHVDLQRAALSIGSLGGGNHFIEVGKSEVSGDVYLIIHSGSRKLGGDVCKYYQDKAWQQVNEMGKMKEKLIKQLKSQKREKEIDSELNKLKKLAAPKELAFLTGDDFDDYMNDMGIVQRFATLNRETMAEIILKEMNFIESSRFETTHNYIDFKRKILRKGAVSAEKGEMLLIPINMRDGSLLCVGKGNAEWNYSAPHGAGRLMSRSKAKEAIPMHEFIQTMKDVYSTSVSSETLDEAPQAYKPIDEIKSAIVDTVDIIGVIKPLYNFKAH
ncbi:MAG: RtcB family protein [Verrucomicrobia bacterium]|nr:RtcB family protein [Prolixibacteraceae bacterium]